MSITVGTRVQLVSKDETAEGTVTGVREHRVAKRGQGSGPGQCDRNGINTRSTLAYAVQWDGVDGVAEYLGHEIEPVTASTALEEIVNQVDEITQAWTGRAADRPTIRRAIRNITEVAQLRGQADAAGTGFFKLLAEEPSRVPQLVRSATSGRVVDVVKALTEYGRK